MADDEKDDALTKTRRKLQAAVEAAEAEHRRQLLQKRIELAQAGVRSMRQKKPIEAVRSYHTYLRILEDWKGVKEGGLSVSHFDKQKDSAELLLISGVYWDLARIYDKTTTPKREKDFFHYMEKYILFSKGMPYQALCAETLRKYIVMGRPAHKSDFKNAYKLIATSKCFVATSLVDVIDEETLPKLRRFRDEELTRSLLGRAWIRVYYALGPALAITTDRLPAQARACLGRLLDALARRVS